MASGIPKEYYKYGLLAGLGIGALLEYENLDIAYHTVGREARAVYAYAKILSLYAKIKRQNLTVPYFFYETVKKYGEKVYIAMHSIVLTVFLCILPALEFTTP